MREDIFVFQILRIFQASTSAVESVVTFPHSLWRNGSLLIDLSCLFKLQWDVPVKRLSAHKFLTDRKTLSLCYCTWFNHRQSGTCVAPRRQSTPPLPSTTSTTAAVSNATHTQPDLYSSLVYKLEQLRFFGYFMQAFAARGGWLRLVTLWMGHYYEPETRAGPAQFFWLSVSTHHIVKQLYYKLVCSVWHWQMRCLDSAEAQSSLFLPPSTDTLARIYTHILKALHLRQKRLSSRGSVCDLDA